MVINGVLYTCSSSSTSLDRVPMNIASRTVVQQQAMRAGATPERWMESLESLTTAPLPYLGDVQAEQEEPKVLGDDDPRADQPGPPGLY